MVSTHDIRRFVHIAPQPVARFGSDAICISGRFQYPGYRIIYIVGCCAGSGDLMPALVGL